MADDPAALAQLAHDAARSHEHSQREIPAVSPAPRDALRVEDHSQVERRQRSKLPSCSSVPFLERRVCQGCCADLLRQQRGLQQAIPRSLYDVRAQRRALFEHHPSRRRRVANKSVSDIRGHESRSRVPDTHCAENPPPRICRLPSPASLSPFRESKSHTALRAPPWAFTLHRVCSHHPRNVSAHALSSPRGIGILAPAPRCDQRAGGRRTRRIPPYTH